MPPTRREEVALETRQLLIDTARDLFTENGYGPTSIEDVVRKAGVTRGALYHHFDGKLGLFRAVFEGLEKNCSELIRAGAEGAKDGWELLTKGTEAFLDACLDPSIQ